MSEIRSGVIIAGGRSTRFGPEEKALASIDGVPMIVRVARRIGPTVDEVIVNCRSSQLDPIREAFECTPVQPTYAIDRTPDQGPLGGMKYGLEAATGDYAAIVGCDMPFVDPDFIARLFEWADGYDAVIPRLADEWLQTTQAVYRTAPMVAACETVLENGGGKILDALDELDCRIVDEADILEHTTKRTFENINTKSELAAARADLEATNSGT